jgi:hypothetical protein
MDSVSVRVDGLVKDRRPPKAAALRAVLDKTINANNQHPSDQGRHALSGYIDLHSPLAAVRPVIVLPAQADKAMTDVATNARAAGRIP